MNFIWQALLILLVGFVLMRIAGKRTVGEMSGLEIITLLSVASVIANAVPEDGFWETTITLCLFVILLIVVQSLTIKLPWIERWFVGTSTVVIENGVVNVGSLKKLRLSVGQLEAKLREQGIASAADVKIATIEFSGRLGYELMPHAKPVTAGELKAILAQLRAEIER